MRSLSERAAFLIAANFVKYSIGFIMPMVLVRLLSQSDYGSYQQLVLVGTAVAGIATLGLPTSVFYFYHHVEADRKGVLLAQTTLLLLIGGIAGGLFIFFDAAGLARGLGNSGLKPLLELYAISVALTIGSEHSIAFMVSQNRYGIALAFETIEIVVRVALLLLPLVLGYGIFGLVVGLVVYGVIRWTGRNGYLFFRTGLDFHAWTRRTLVREQFAYSLPVALVNVTGLVGMTFNKGIIAASFSPAQYAVYAVGNFPIPLSSIFQASVADVLRATLPPLVRAGDLGEVVRLVRESSRKLSMIVLPSFVFLFAFSEPLITLLFTNRYRESVQIFRIFILTVPLDMLILSAIPQVFGRTRANLYVNISTMIVLVTLSYVLLRAIGFYGAAIASVVAQYYSSTVFSLVASHLTRARLRDLFPWAHMFRVLLCSIGAAAAGLYLYHWVPGGRGVQLFASAAAYCLIALGLGLLSGTITAADRRLAQRWLVRFWAGARRTGADA